MDGCENLGMLFQWCPLTGAMGNPYRVSAGSEFYVGRDVRRWFAAAAFQIVVLLALTVKLSVRCSQYVLDFDGVSSVHLRIYTVGTDTESQGVPPLVYAEILSRRETCWNGHRVDRERAVLLSGGDVLRLSAECYVRFESLEEDVVDGFSVIQQREMRLFHAWYTITRRKLGQGAYGTVHMAVDEESGRQVACKIIDTSIKDQWSKSGKRVKKLPCGLEVEILSRLSHPNIITLERVFRSENTMYIFQELGTAGDLWTYVDMTGPVDEVEAALYIYQILLALNFIHSQNIVHCDVKPENILMMSSNSGRVVLTDFGCAQMLDSASGRLHSCKGTLEYRAPELDHPLGHQGFSKPVDLWAVGCTMVVLLSGEHPFTYSSLRRPPREFVDLDGNHAWQEVGSSAKNLVGGLLQADEMQRFTVREALQHEWFTSQMDIHKRYGRAIRNWRPRTDQTVIIDLESLEPEFGSNIDVQTPLKRRSTVLRQASKGSAQPQSGLCDGPNESPFLVNNQVDMPATFALCLNCKRPMSRVDLDRNDRISSERDAPRKRLRRPFSPQAWMAEPALTRVH